LKLATKGWVSPAGYECRPYTPYEELWHGIRADEALLADSVFTGKAREAITADWKRLHDEGLRMAVAMANNAAAKGLPVGGELQRNIELHREALK